MILGQCFQAGVKLKVKGNKGDTLKLNFYEDSGNSFEQSDTYILKGSELEIWEPKFTWHAFRYVEIESNNVELNIDNIEGRVVNTDVSSAGNFECSNDLFTRIENDYKRDTDRKICTEACAMIVLIENVEVIPAMVRYPRKPRFIILKCKAFIQNG